MNTYKHYKNTDIDGLKTIPSHWERWKFNRIIFFQEGPGLRNWQFKDNGIKVICVTNIVPPIIDFSKMTKYISNEEYKEKYLHFTVNKGDILLASSGASWGKVAVYNSDEKVILNTSTIRLNAIKDSKIDKNIIKYFLNSKYVNSQLNNLLTGSCQPNFGPTHLKKIYLALPPKQEQTTIANFLDYKTEKINRFIKKKKQLIELLNEQKAAIINQAVTKGLNPNVPMKDSGIEWLGEIPEHWVTKPLKYFVTHNDEALSNSTDKEYELNYIDIGNVDSNGDIEEIVKYKFKDAPSRARRIVKVGDVIISTVRTYLKAIAIIEVDEDVIVSTGFAVLRPRKSIIGEFLNYAVRANYFIEDVCSNSFGVSYPAINASELVTLKLAIPNNETEQKNIVEFIKNESKTIDKTISTIEKEITLVEEYKTALIAEAVTGKIDVRNFKLPAKETPLAMVAEEAANYNKAN